MLTRCGEAVERGLVSGCAKDGRQSGGSRAFAIGPGDEHAGKSALRIADCSQHLAHVGQVEFVRGSGGQFVAEGVKLLDGGLVRHADDFRLQQLRKDTVEPGRGQVQN